MVVSAEARDARGAPREPIEPGKAPPARQGQRRRTEPALSLSKGVSARTILRGGNAVDQVFLFGFAFGANGEGVEHA
jgi:hypothetical protein